MKKAKSTTVEMVKKKQKSSKKLKKRANSWVKEDVQVHTGLPPQVEGQLRCYLKMCVNQILWMVPNPPEITHVKVQWWGESSEGALFRPIDVKKANKSVSKTTARYAIRSGPKQFAAYINDMQSLAFEVLSGTMMVTVGRAQIDQISLLAPNRPINGFFPVFSADSEKVADLQVSILLESLMASYDSMASSIPTPDTGMSTDLYASSSDVQPINPPRVVPTPAPLPTYLHGEDPFNSPLANKTKSMRGTHPRGVDDHIYHGHVTDSWQSGSTWNTYPINGLGSTKTMPAVHGQSSSHQGGKAAETSGVVLSGTQGSALSTLQGIESIPTYSSGNKDAAKTVIQTTAEKPGLMNRPKTQPKGKENVIDSGVENSERSSNLISALLERGTKLREAMIISALDDPATQRKGSLSDQPMATTDASGVHDGFKTFVTEIPHSVYSTMKPESNLPAMDQYKEAMTTTAKSMDFDKLIPGKLESDISDFEGRAVDLVFGHDLTDPKLEMYRAMERGSPTSSISGDDVFSDFGDPLHDDEILQELFYKDGESESDNVSLYTDDDEYVEHRRRYRSRSNSTAASIEDPGNMRPPSRNSSTSSIHRVGRDRTPDTSTSSRPRRPSRSRSSEKKTNVSKGRKKKKSRSRSNSKRRESSDTSELMNTSKASETSRVSFDPTPSDIEETSISTAATSHRDAMLDGMSVERLTLLGRVHVARVVIDRLLITEDLQEELTPQKNRTKSRIKGKPPRPAKKSCTYFVEYQFPVIATSRDKYSPNAMATEVMRVASKRVTDGAVSFGHRSVFPVMFDGDAIEKWWKSSLVFKLYSRNASQKVPKLIGICSVPLRVVLKSEALILEKDLDVKDRSGRGAAGDSLQQTKWAMIGSLRISIELASDSREFSTALAKTRLAEMGNPRIIPVLKPAPKPMENQKTKREKSPSYPRGLSSTSGTQTEPRPTNINDMPLVLPDPPRETQSGRVPHQPQAPLTHPPSHQYHTPLFGEVMEESMTMHTMLMIPSGENITLQGLPPLRNKSGNPTAPPKQSFTWTGRDMSTRNVYLVCRMFWCDDITRSSVCWGTFDPEFNFCQVAPVLLTGSLLERMRNNVMVIEVWDKKTSSENDQLVGMVKLPLQQFYMSFRDRKVAGALLRSQYPCISVDTEMPIVNPFSGTQFGKLKVLLAMGSMEQIYTLQKLKQDQGTAISIPERPTHYLERQNIYTQGRSIEDYSAPDNVIEHIFEVSVESIKGLQLLDNMIWGEADCFIQYHFPTQIQTKQEGAPKIIHATPSLKTYRTSTTLCVPDPVFNDVIRHRLTMPEGTPVQREILQACAGAGGGAGGVPFEVWCRYYYPNVRDQVIAKGNLPLAKLCSMVTMQKRGETNVQTFTLPLTSLATDGNIEDPEVTSKMQESGLLEVTLNYKTRVMKGEHDTDPNTLTKSMPGAQCCISVGVLRASGLKASANVMAKQDAGMQYVSEVGVNSYVRVRLSFLQREDERLTRTVARTFAPDYTYHMDFPCPLLWTEPGSDALSLAEILENAEASFEIWHQVPPATLDMDRHYVNTGSEDVKGRKMISHSGDILLGTVTVPLIDLLTRKTGVSGWYGVNLPSVGWDSSKAEHDQSEAGGHGNKGLERIVGGLELSIKFAHHEDLERVVHAARGVGWSPDFAMEDRDWESADESVVEHYHQVALSVDLACFPVQNALMIGQTQLDRIARCYIRYKFYDKGATCSRLTELEENDSDYLQAPLQYSKTLAVPGSSPFKWYLREERLEIQVWVTYHADTEGSKKRPRHRDKLIGSAYVDLSSLADTRRRQHRVSGIYPLFKPGASSLGGACIRAHITLKPHASGIISESDEESDVPYSQKSKSSPRKTTKDSRIVTDSVKFSVDMENTFGVHISIERALHMPYVYEKESSTAITPNCYVSYQTAEQEEPACTSIFYNSENPLWSHEHDTRMHKDLLTDSTKNLVFKVWHKPKDAGSTADKTADKVLGFVSVDLSPLMTGFQQLCGWYNIMDFNGQCQGQIKVSITPQETLLRSKGGSSNLSEELPSTTHYHTIGSYSRFPSHLSWYPEQHIKVDSQLPHYTEHFENVRKFHESLKGSGGGATDMPLPSTSRSFLFQSLKTNMAELDDITKKLKERLGGGHHGSTLSLEPASQHDTATDTGTTNQMLELMRSTVGGLNVTQSTLGGQSYGFQTQSGDMDGSAPNSARSRESEEIPISSGVRPLSAQTKASTGAHDITSSGVFTNEEVNGGEGNGMAMGLITGLVHDAVGNLLGSNSAPRLHHTWPPQSPNGSSQAADIPLDTLTKGVLGAPMFSTQGSDSTLHGSNSGTRNLPGSSHFVWPQKEGDSDLEDVLPSHLDSNRQDGTMDTHMSDSLMAHRLDELTLQNPSDLSQDGDDGESTFIVPKALNDVSNVNFGNTLGGDFNGPPQVGPRLQTDDSWFSNTQDENQSPSHLGPEPAEVPLTGGGTGNLEDTGEHSTSTFHSGSHSTIRNIGQHLHRKPQSPRTPPSEKGSKSSTLKSHTGVKSDYDNDGSFHSGQEQVNLSDQEEDLLSQENPSRFVSVSRTSSEHLSKSQRTKSTRKAAMFRREYEMQRQGYSSSEEENGGAMKTTWKSIRRKPLEQETSFTLLDNVELSNGDFLHSGSSKVPLHVLENGGQEVNSEERSGVDGSTHSHPEDSNTIERETQRLDDYGEDECDGMTQHQLMNGISTQETMEGIEENNLQLSQFSDQEDTFQSQGTTHGVVKSQGSQNGTPRSQGSNQGTPRSQGSSHGTARSQGSSHGTPRSQGSNPGTSNGLPNFFLMPQDLEQNMRALKTVNSQKEIDPAVVKGRVDAVKDYKERFSSSFGSSGRLTGTLSSKFSKPSAEQSQRIAKIFSSKFSNSR